MRLPRRFPHYRQDNSYDCGPTALRIVARHYGTDYSAEMLRRHCHIAKRGVSMLGISEAAEYIGFETAGVKMTFAQLAEEALFPCIVHWNQNHFVVCYGIDRNRRGAYRIRISDPASQRLTYTREEFERSWTGSDKGEERMGTALLLAPGDDFGKVKEECRGSRRTIGSFAKYFTPHRSMIGQLLLAMLASSAIQLAVPFLSQAMVDQGVNARDMGVIMLILIAQLLFFATTLSIDCIRSWIRSGN